MNSLPLPLKLRIHTVPGTVLPCLILVPQKMAAHARLMSSSFAMSDFFCLATDML